MCTATPGTNIRDIHRSQNSLTRPIDLLCVLQAIKNTAQGGQETSLYAPFSLQFPAWDSLNHHISLELVITVTTYLPAHSPFLSEELLGQPIPLQQDFSPDPSVVCLMEHLHNCQFNLNLSKLSFQTTQNIPLPTVFNPCIAVFPTLSSMYIDIYCVKSFKQNKTTPKPFSTSHLTKNPSPNQMLLPVMPHMQCHSEMLKGMNRSSADTCISTQA